MIDEITFASTTSTDHFSRVRLQFLGPCSADESLRCREEAGKEGKVAECGDLSICFHGGFTENGKTSLCLFSI